MNRSFLTVSLLFTALASAGQKWESYELTEKGDTINRVDGKGVRQGMWLVKTGPLRGEPGYEEEGEYRNGIKEGVWRRYSLQGDLIAMEQFKRGYRDGTQMYFTPLGEPLREETWKSVDPDNPYDTIDVPDLNNPMVSHSKVIRHEAAEVKHGPWKYFDPLTGRVFKTENYISGQKQGPPTAQNGPPSGESAEKKTPKPPAVLDWEKKNSGKKKVAVRDGRTGG
jgi:hypothetical protein